MDYKICNGFIKEKKKETLAFEELKDRNSTYKYTFLSTRPYFVKKYVMKRKYKVVRDIVGPRLPDMWDTAQINDSKESLYDRDGSYSRYALILFKPFRKRRTLRTS